MMTVMAEITLADVPAGHGVISKMQRDDGDFRVTWNPADPAEVANARQAFQELRSSGYAIHKVEGRRREVIREFDPALGAMQLVAHRPNRGG
jgi:hypothetical protein